ncbi:MAG: hypothetical protein ABIW81_05375 [Terrimesophilobacter sp.]
MKYKVLLVVGVGIGYILGARAGRPRYEKIKAKATDAWEDPRVQKVVTDGQAFVKENAPIVQDKVVAGTRAAVAGTQATYAKTAETAKEISDTVVKTAKDTSEKVAGTAREVTSKVAKTTQGVREKIAGAANEVRAALSDRGDEVVDGVIIAAVKARDSALEDDADD